MAEERTIKVLKNFLRKQPIGLNGRLQIQGIRMNKYTEELRELVKVGRKRGDVQGIGQQERKQEKEVAKQDDVCGVVF